MSFQKTIALVFDFDDTLAPDSTGFLLEKIGVNVEAFWNKTVNPLLLEDWDPIPAYLYSLIQLSGSGNVAPLTKDFLTQTGRSLICHEGVEQLLQSLRNQVNAAGFGITLEYYIVSSGIGEIVRNSSIARFFNDIWACEFHYHSDYSIAFPKKIISFTDKTRYLFQINKGLTGDNSRQDPYAVNRRIPAEALRIPLSNMIYVGDGYTDIPCFSLLKRNGGIPIGVYDKNNPLKRDRAWKFVQDERVSNLLSANYSEGSDLCNTLEMAVNSIINKIKKSEL